jgi:hypothetical protein
VSIYYISLAQKVVQGDKKNYARRQKELMTEQLGFIVVWFIT